MKTLHDVQTVYMDHTGIERNIKKVKKILSRTEFFHGILQLTVFVLGFRIHVVHLTEL